MLVDARGLACPLPARRTREVLLAHAGGEPVVVLVDFPPAVSSVAWEAAEHGYEAKVAPSGEHEWQLTLRAAPHLTTAQLLDRFLSELALLDLPPA